MTKNTTTKYQVPNLERAMAIIELLSKFPAGLNQKEISTTLSIPSNSAFRITMTLLDLGYLIRDEKTKEFKLSAKLMAVGSAATCEVSLIENAIESMRQLRDETKETVLLGALLTSENRGVTLEQVPGLHPFKFLLDVGSSLILHVGAPGKCLLAWLPDNERQTIIKNLKLTKYTPKTITTKKALNLELKNVKISGYAIDRGEWMEEMHCVGAPILDRFDYPVGAIWVTAPSSRMPESDFQNIGEKVMAYASTISNKIKHK